MKIRKSLLACSLMGGLFASDPARGTVYVTNFRDGTVSSVPDTGGAATLFATGLTKTQGITIAPSGTIYVASQFSPTQATAVIHTLSPSGTVTPFVTIPGRGFTGLTHDSAGNLYVSLANADVIDMITPGGAIATYATGVGHPQGLAFDSAGNLFVADYGGSRITKVAPGGGAATLFATLVNPEGIAVDPLGNVYASGFANGVVEKFSPLGLDLGIYSTVTNPYGLMFDSSGNLLVTSSAPGGIGSTVFKIPPGGGAASTFATGFNGPLYIAIPSAATGVPLPPALYAALLCLPVALLFRRTRERGLLSIRADKETLFNRNE